MSILIAVAALAAAQPISLEQRVTIGQVAATQCSSAIAISVITPEGTASITNGKGLSDSDPVRIASITKTATAAAALRLVEDGLLDLDTPIADLIDPELGSILRADGYDIDAITTRHLLSHSAGLYSHAEDPRYAPLVFADPGHRWTAREQVALMAEYGDPLGDPGTAFSYSDTGYVLVGNIIERITDRPLGPAVRALLGLDNLGLRESWWEIYEADPDSVERARQFVDGNDVTMVDGSADAFGGGGLVMSMRDLAILFRAINEGTLFKQPETLELMRWQGLHENAARYRLGIFAAPSPDGRTTWFHSGFWGTLASHRHEDGLTVAGATNEQSDFGCLSRAVRAIANAVN